MRLVNAVEQTGHLPGYLATGKLLLPPSGAARSWLVSIVHHRVIDYLRNIRRRSSIEDTLLDS